MTASDPRESVHVHWVAVAALGCCASLAALSAGIPAPHGPVLLAVPVVSAPVFAFRVARVFGRMAVLVVGVAHVLIGASVGPGFAILSRAALGKSITPGSAAAVGALLGLLSFLPALLPPSRRIPAWVVAVVAIVALAWWHW